MWEAKVVIDFAPLHGAQIEIESFQVENQVVWNIFETSPATNQCPRSLKSSVAYRLTALTWRSQEEHLYLLSAKDVSLCMDEHSRTTNPLP
jgi:hypothetical protein